MLLVFCLRLVPGCLLCFAVMLFGFWSADFGLGVMVVCVVCCCWGCFGSVCLLCFALFCCLFVF